jgi:hypothetical protein
MADTSFDEKASGQLNVLWFAMVEHISQQMCAAYIDREALAPVFGRKCVCEYAVWERFVRQIPSFFDHLAKDDLVSHKCAFALLAQRSFIYDFNILRDELAAACRFLDLLTAESQDTLRTYIFIAMADAKDIPRLLTRTLTSHALRLLCWKMFCMMGARAINDRGINPGLFSCCRMLFDRIYVPRCVQVGDPTNSPMFRFASVAVAEQTSSTSDIFYIIEKINDAFMTCGYRQDVGLSIARIGQAAVAKYLYKRFTLEQMRMIYGAHGGKVRKYKSHAYMQYELITMLGDGIFDDRKLVPEGHI